MSHRTYTTNSTAGKCARCHGETLIRRTTRIERFPDTLILHLKRLVTRPTGNVRLGHELTFPMILDMHPYSAARETGQRSPDFTYTLQGVVVHRGQADAGHFYSFIRVRASDKWIKVDDRSSSPVLDLRQVQERQWFGSLNHSVTDACAVMLFYGRNKHGPPPGEAAERGTCEQKTDMGGRRVGVREAPFQ